MTENENLNIVNLLKKFYGASEVVVDTNTVTVYGSNVDSVYTAIVVEYGDIYDVSFEYRDDDLKYVVLRLEKKT